MSRSQALCSLLASTVIVPLIAPEATWASCRFLMPIGGGGEPVVTKRISPDGLVRRNNWNTDFAVDRNLASYRIILQSASSERGVFPIAAFLRFTDNTDLRVVNENRSLEP